MLFPCFQDSFDSIVIKNHQLIYDCPKDSQIFFFNIWHFTRLLRYECCGTALMIIPWVYHPRLCSDHHYVVLNGCLAIIMNYALCIMHYESGIRGLFRKMALDHLHDDVAQYFSAPSFQQSMLERPGLLFRRHNQRLRITTASNQNRITLSCCRALFN